LQSIIRNCLVNILRQPLRNQDKPTEARHLVPQPVKKLKARVMVGGITSSACPPNSPPYQIAGASPAKVGQGIRTRIRASEQRAPGENGTRPGLSEPGVADRVSTSSFRHIHTRHTHPH
jgi:hypothetical protein